jgi:hypothetical protein
MSETQVKITGSFQAVDDDGKQYHVVEHTLFRKTTTAAMSLGDGDGEELKQYKLSSGKPLKQISSLEFKIEDDGTIIRRSQTEYSVF